MIIYTVKPGDTLYGIARSFGVDLSELQRYNALKDPNRLSVGQNVLIPVNGRVHTVAAGDSLYSIASSYGVPLETVIRRNGNLRPPYRISEGQKVIIPTNALKRTITVNGYAYPDIKSDVLRETLPYLTFVSIFGYSASSDGTLDEINDAPLISSALAAGVAPFIVITNTDGSGFNGSVAHAFLSDRNISDRLIEAIVSKATTKGYRGINIDFEYLYPSDRENYNSFLSRLKTSADREGLFLSVAVAPKTSSEQRGSLYEAHDYGAIGNIADYCIIMTYEWGYSYGPPMAVSPYSEVKRVLEYARLEMPSEKILMGMPNYGYDWTLPFKEGVAARAVSLDGALTLAADKGAEIKFSETAKAPFFEYYQDGAEHIVWFDNAASIAAKLGLVNDLDLGGASIWTVNRFYAPAFAVISDMFTVKKTI